MTLEGDRLILRREYASALQAALAELPPDYRATAAGFRLAAAR